MSLAAQHACQTSIQSAAAPQRSAAPAAARAATAAAAARWRPSRRPCVAAPGPRHYAAAPRRLTPASAADGEDSEVAVFRFTSGSDTLDTQVPRVVGVAGAVLLVLNHFLGEQVNSDAQLRAELLGVALSAVACVVPTIDARLKELQPGRGRQAAASSVAGAASVFALQPGMAEGTKQELAWASYTLLLNANICGLAVFWDGQAVLARGLLGAAALGAAAPAPGSSGGGKQDAGKVLAALSGGAQGPAAASSGWQQGAVYCGDRAAIGKAGAGGWACVPEGVESLLVQPLLALDSGSGSASSSSSSSGAARGVLLLLSERPRALSSKERVWAAAVAAKLHTALGGSP